MTGFENHVGITITNSKIQLVEIIFNNNRFYLNNVDEAYFNEPVNFDDDKETKISSRIQGAFNEILIKKPLESKSVSFALPFELFNSLQVPYDNTLLPQDLEEELRWEFTVLYPFLSSKDLAVQYIEVEKNELTNFNSIIAIAIQRRYIQMVNNFCINNNLKLNFIDNIHMASERALTLNYPSATKGLNLSIYFSSKHLSILYSLNGKPIRLKVIALNDAGEIPTLLFEESNLQESFKINRGLIDNAFICGEDISETIIKTLENILGIDFIYYNPFDKINPEPKLFDNKFYVERYNSFSPAAGIAMRLA